MALVNGTNCGFVTTAPTEDPSGALTGTIDNISVAGRFTSPAGAVKVTEIGWWCGNATEETNFDAGIYDTSEGLPVNLLNGVGRNQAKGTDAGWKKITGLNITITENTVYYIGVQVDNTATATVVDATNDANEYREYSSAATALPSPWNGGSGTGRLLAFYAVYETGTAGRFMTTNTKFL